MYFAILGKNQDISLAELEITQANNINRENKYLITFETDHEELLSTLWGITKRGRVVSEEELPAFFEWKKILWVEDKALWLKFKKLWLIRRFKITEAQKTDKEIKHKWIELIQLWTKWWTKIYGVVLWYQNIPLYETIDFKKPSRSMQMGMMPAKLTHILINIGIIHSPSQTTIYDPFAGSWTTWMLANFLWYNFIGSDIDITHLSQNLPRRENTYFYHPKLSLDFFQQDITHNISHDKIPPNTIIVTEGRLGPIINKYANDHNITTAEAEVIKLYKAFLTTATQLKQSWQLTTIVTTIPHYFRHENITGPELFAHAQKLWRECNYIDEIYARPRQRVGRKILIFT